MNRMEKIKKLRNKISEDVAILSIILGKKSDFIEDVYIQPKRDLLQRRKIVEVLDMENYSRYRRLIVLIDLEIISWKREMKEKEEERVNYLEGIPMEQIEADMDKLDKTGVC